MTTAQLIRRLNRLPAGEYTADAEKLFLATAVAKSDYTENPITGDRYATLSKVVPFSVAFEEAKYGIEYASKGKIRYIGTNDLSTLVITK